MDALAEMHAVDWRACGLEGFGKPTGYLDRQLRRFGGLWEHNKTRELPLVQEVGEWLAANKPESPEATIVHGDYRLGNVMFADDAPGAADRDLRLGDGHDRRPARRRRLHDGHVVGADPDDAADDVRLLLAVTRAEGFMKRDELIARYEERSGRSMSDLRWYQALAHLEGGGVHGGQLQALARGHHRRPVPEVLRRGRAAARRGGARDHEAARAQHVSDSGLLVDFGGVLTTNVFQSFKQFAEAEGLPPDTVKQAFREDREALGLLRRLEKGELTRGEFEPLFAERIGVENTDGLVGRLFAGVGPDERDDRCGAPARAARE